MTTRCAAGCVCVYPVPRSTRGVVYFISYFLFLIIILYIFNIQIIDTLFFFIPFYYPCLPLVLLCRRYFV